MKRTWPIEIDCPNCAAKLEAALAQLPGVEHARVDYVRKTVTLAAKEADFARLTQAMVDTARQIEPDAVIHLDGEGKPGHHHGEGCACCHGEHEHEEHDHAHHHEHGHDHGHDHGRPLPFGLDAEKLLPARMILSAALLVLGMVLSGPARIVLLLLSYLIAGYDVLLRAVRN
ncbi:MAG: cation transporter, partial [Aristaeellaceae bacterium]